jgi:hypothetical protein
VNPAGSVRGPSHTVTVGKTPMLSPEEARALIDSISGHSTRVGASQDMIRLGAKLPGVMQAGRRKSPEMVARYTRRLAQRRDR